MGKQSCGLHVDPLTFRQNTKARIVKKAQLSFLYPDNIDLLVRPPAAEGESFLKKEANVSSMVMLPSL